MLLSLVKQSIKVLASSTFFFLLDSIPQMDPSVNHSTVSTEVHEHMNRDICAAVVRLVLLLRDPKSYKKLLACRGRDAERLLDLFQDVSGSLPLKCWFQLSSEQLLDFGSFSVVKPLISKALARLSRASGLYPRCFPLSGLCKVGQQVTGGGFGDIWKGWVHEPGQKVSVKVMRVFEDSDVEAVLKVCFSKLPFYEQGLRYIQEFGREAVIWRQLCNPNVLPFFGIYYLEKRLCLVSPWMENGNIMEFLAKDSPNTERLPLVSTYSEPETLNNYRCQ